MTRPALALLAAIALVGCDPAGGAADAGPTGCPPPGPFGYGVGDLLTDLEFEDCDGGRVTLHSLCGQVAVVAAYYGWCATCSHYAKLVDTLAAEHGGQGLRGLVVVVEDGLRDPATAAYCAEVRDYLGLAVATVIDPARTIESYGDTDLILVADRDGRIAFLRQGPDDDAVRTVVEATLGP